MLPVYATATAMPDLSRICNLQHSSPQHWILKPLIKARDRTHNLVVPSQIRFRCATPGTPKFHTLLPPMCHFSGSFWSPLHQSKGVNKPIKRKTCYTVLGTQSQELVTGVVRMRGNGHSSPAGAEGDGS